MAEKMELNLDDVNRTCLGKGDNKLLHFFLIYLIWMLYLEYGKFFLISPLSIR